MDDKKYVSKERYEEFQAELKDLRTRARQDIADRLRQAKDFGDLSENSEYAEAREEQNRVETRICELDDYLKNVSVVASHKKTSGGDVAVGSTITVKKGAKTFTYEIVGSEDANPVGGKISNESPLGRAFLGQKVGGKVTVKTPAGENVYEILTVE